MQKAYLNPTPDQTFEIVGDGPYNFTRVLAHTRELEAAGNVEDACNERYQAFQRLAGLLPEDEEINLEWSHRNSQSALELIRAREQNPALPVQYAMIQPVFVEGETLKQL